MSTSDKLKLVVDTGRLSGFKLQMLTVMRVCRRQAEMSTQPKEQQKDAVS